MVTHQIVVDESATANDRMEFHPAEDWPTGETWLIVTSGEGVVHSDTAEMAVTGPAIVHFEPGERWRFEVIGRYPCATRTLIASE